MKTIIVIILLLAPSLFAQVDVDAYKALQAHDDSVRNALLCPAEITRENDTTIYESEKIDDTVTIEYYIIDSLQNAYDICSTVVYERNQLYKKSSTYNFNDKIRYMNYLLQYSLQDTSSVLTHCNGLIILRNIKLDLYQAIIETQGGNIRSRIAGYIRKIKQEQIRLTDYMLKLTHETVGEVKHSFRDTLCLD